MKIGTSVFVVVFLLLIGATAGYCVGSTLPLFMKYTNELKRPIYLGFLVNFSMIVLETLCAAAGSALLLRKGRKNVFILLSLIIATIDFRVETGTYVALMLDYGFILPVGSLGIGFNVVGVVMLAWYLLIRNEPARTAVQPA
ncbi:MAG TPA: hypothetical protein P5287_05715 [bacterium]|nr:hypothetical protein [bacterium]